MNPDCVVTLGLVSSVHMLSFRIKLMELTPWVKPAIWEPTMKHKSKHRLKNCSKPINLHILGLTHEIGIISHFTLSVERGLNSQSEVYIGFCATLWLNIPTVSTFWTKYDLSHESQGLGDKYNIHNDSADNNKMQHCGCCNFNVFYLPIKLKG